MAIIPTRERVVVKGHPIDQGNQEKRPVCTTLRLVRIVAVIDRQERMCNALERR